MDSAEDLLNMPLPLPINVHLKGWLFMLVQPSLHIRNAEIHTSPDFEERDFPLAAVAPGRPGLEPVALA